MYTARRWKTDKKRLTSFALFLNVSLSSLCLHWWFICLTHTSPISFCSLLTFIASFSSAVIFLCRSFLSLRSCRRLLDASFASISFFTRSSSALFASSRACSFFLSSSAFARALAMMVDVSITAGLEGGSGGGTRVASSSSLCIIFLAFGLFGASTVSLRSGEPFFFHWFRIEAFPGDSATVRCVPGLSNSANIS